MSKIEWTERTWNPIVGCSVISPGCTNCYAMRQAGRIQKMNPTGGSGTAYVNHYDGTTIETARGKHVWTGKAALAPDNILHVPLCRLEPTTYFVNSMGDLFHESVPDDWIDKVFAIMALSPQHTFQILTKRSRRMHEYMTSSSLPGTDNNPAENIRCIVTALTATPSRREAYPILKKFPRNGFVNQYYGNSPTSG